MSDQKAQNEKTEEIIVTRLFDAPVELVWKAWTDPKQVMRWWGPQYYTSPSCKIDFREGGRYIFCMHAPKDQGGQDSYTAGVYRKIIPMELIEFTQGMSDKEGNIIDPVQVGMPPDFPQELRTVVNFKRVRDDMTELTIVQYGWVPSQMLVYAIAGLHQSIDKLGVSLKK